MAHGVAAVGFGIVFVCYFGGSSDRQLAIVDFRNLEFQFLRLCNHEWLGIQCDVDL